MVKRLISIILSLVVLISPTLLVSAESLSSMDTYNCSCEADNAFNNECLDNCQQSTEMKECIVVVNPQYMTTPINARCPYCSTLNNINWSDYIRDTGYPEYLACGMVCTSCHNASIVKLYFYQGVCTVHDNFNNTAFCTGTNDGNASSHILTCDFCNQSTRKDHEYSTYSAGQGTDSLCNICGYDRLSISISSPSSGTSVPTGTSISVSGNSSIRFYRAAASITSPSGAVQWYDEIYDNTSYSSSISYQLTDPGTYTIAFFVRDIDPNLFESTAKSTSITITAVGCAHTYAPATCTTPSTCTKCKETTGTALGHSYGSATCTSPATCIRCPETTGTALGHNLVAATCLLPQRCTRSGCSYTNGTALGHNYGAATCTTPSTCSRCSATTGTALGHNLAAATCTLPQKCTRSGCSYTYGSALGHNFAAATCTNPQICTRCYTTQGTALGHLYGSWSSEDYMNHKRTCSRCSNLERSAHSLSTTTTYPASSGVCNVRTTKCSVCGYVSSTVTDTSHSYTNNCDTSCNDCGYTRSITHNYYVPYYVNVGTSGVCRRQERACTVCGAIQVVSTVTSHTYTNSADKTCNYCGYTRP